MIECHSERTGAQIWNCHPNTGATLEELNSGVLIVRNVWALHIRAIRRLCGELLDMLARISRFSRFCPLVTENLPSAVPSRAGEPNYIKQKKIYWNVLFSLCVTEHLFVHTGCR